MVDYFSVEDKTFLIVAEFLKILPQVYPGLSYIEKYIYFFSKQMLS